MQTSITTWLNKPKAVNEPPTERQLPTPPQEATIPVAVSPKPVAATAPNPAPASDNLSIIVARLSRHGTSFSRLPPEVVVSTVSSDLIPALRRLNTLLLPIPYQDKFYKETVEDPVIASITFAALWPEDAVLQKLVSNRNAQARRLVAAIRCRIIPPPPDSPDPDARPQLYIATLATLSPYRRHGIARALLELATFRAIQDHNVDCVTAHVWAANDEAIEWYRMRGFEEVRRIPKYYRRLNPAEAVLMARQVSALDLGASGALKEVG